MTKLFLKLARAMPCFFQTHQFMLEDLDYVEAIENMIQTQSVNAEYAVSVTGDNFSQIVCFPWMMTICVSVQLM